MPIRTGKDAGRRPTAKKEPEPKSRQRAGQENSVQSGYTEESQKTDRNFDGHGYSSTLNADDADEDGFDTNADTTKIKILAGVAAVVIVAVVLLVIKLVVPGGSDDKLEIKADTEFSTPVATQSPDDGFVQGDTDYADSKNNQPGIGLSSSSEYVKDLNGEEVPVNYSVQSRQYITAHVSYVAKRAVIDEGMEMYWVDVVYKKKKYRLQVPFYYFKDFEEEGICRVEIEVLELENGSQIISYMQVIDEEEE